MYYRVPPIRTWQWRDFSCTEAEFWYVYDRHRWNFESGSQFQNRLPASSAGHLIQTRFHQIKQDKRMAKCDFCERKSSSEARKSWWLLGTKQRSQFFFKFCSSKDFSETKSGFTLEHVGQYFKKEDLSHPFTGSSNPWLDFLDTHPKLKSSKFVFTNHREKSLLQLHDALIETVSEVLVKTGVRKRVNSFILLKCVHLFSIFSFSISSIFQSSLLCAFPCSFECFDFFRVNILFKFARPLLSFFTFYAVCSFVVHFLNVFHLEFLKLSFCSYFVYTWNIFDSAIYYWNISTAIFLCYSISICRRLRNKEVNSCIHH